MADVPRTFALEHLYEHQDYDWVVDAIPFVLAWLGGAERGGDGQLGYALDVAIPSGAPPARLGVKLTWSVVALERHDASLRARVERLLSLRSIDREHIPENAAYGLALVAISLLMPGRRVISMVKGRAPDFLLDGTTAQALRGVEVAGRSTGGFATLGSVRRVDKWPRLAARGDIAEVHLSLWCASPAVSEFYQVKP